MNELTIAQILTACSDKPMRAIDLCEITGKSKQYIHKTLKAREEGSLIDMKLIYEQNNMYITTEKGKEYLEKKEKERRDAERERAAEDEKRKSGYEGAAYLISSYKAIFEEKYIEQIELFQQTKKTVVIDFKDIIEINPDLALLFYNNPEDHSTAIAMALRLIIDDDCKFILQNISSKIKPIGDIRHEDYNQIISVRGIIAQRGEPRPRVQKLKYECPSCGNTQSITQLERTITQPKKCNGCGYKGKFSCLSKEFKTVQVIKIEELGEDVGSRAQPTDLYVLLENSLCEVQNQHLYNCGNVVKIVGVVKEREKKEKDSVDFDQIMYAYCVEGESEDLNMTIDDKESRLINEISTRQDYVRKIVDCFAPEISECDEMKEALLLQAVSSDTGDKRGIIHVAFIGDPATGKSSLAKEVKKIIPRARYVSGDSASQVGLTASVEKDELTGGYVLKAGALPLANNSVCVIDELDKLKEKDALHGALEAGEINVDKAGIHARLRAKTAVLATLNPRYGRFDRNEPFLKQIEISQPLLTRFDLVFIQLDGVGQKDRNVARSILGYEEDKERLLTTKTLSKYLWKAKLYKPILDDNAKKFLEDYYIAQRKNLVNPEQGFFFNPRHFAGILRMTLAYAKLQFRNIATVEDANRAILIFTKSLQSIKAFNPTAMSEYENGSGYIEKDLVDKIRMLIESQDCMKADIIENVRGQVSGLSEQEISKVLYKYLGTEWKMERAVFHSCRNAKSKEAVQ